MIDLELIQEFTKAELIILADKNGNVINTLNTDYETNLALMTETAFSMCKDLLKDLNNGDLVQLLGKSTDNYFIINKLKDNSIITIVSKDSSKLGLLLKYMNDEKNFYRKTK